MKKFLASALMVMFATSALAAETAYVLQPLRVGAGDEYVDTCEQDAPIPANGGCGDGRICPIGYEPVNKICWDGGFHSCGTVCKNSHMFDGN